MFVSVASAATVLSLLYWAAVWRAVRGFFRAPRQPPAAAPPKASVLKPVKGADPGAYENFAGFCRQDYPDYEVLFGVADPTDPVAAVVRRLQADFPQRTIRLIHVPADGPNPKSVSLHRLAAAAAGDVLVMSDADVRVGPDYLRRVTAPLQDPGVGAVTCPYATRPAGALASRLAALYLNAEFVPSAVFAHRTLGVPVGLGATIAVRRRDLIRAGGYSGIVDYLSDDYRLVDRIVGLGLRVELSRCVVNQMFGKEDFGELWRQETRWAMGVRRCRPHGYCGLPLTYTTPLALALAAATGFSAVGLALLAAAVGVRVFLAWRMQHDLCGQSEAYALAWLPARECLSLLVWAAGLFGRRVAWRGRVFALRPDGRLEPS